LRFAVYFRASSAVLRFVAVESALECGITATRGDAARFARGGSASLGFQGKEGRAMAKDETSSVRKQSAGAKRPKKITAHIRRLREMSRLYEGTGK
jgi:hypothetical protein